MAIAPIDLQTMYSQLSNVSKTLSTSQQAQLTEAMQQQSKIQREIENASKVQQTSNEKANAQNINQNGSNSQSFQNSKRCKSELDENIENQENEQVSKANDLSYLGMGRIIDIKR